MSQQKAIGLDVGTSRLVLAKRAGDNYEYESQLNAFVTIPYSRMTEASLRKEGVPFAVEQGRLIVCGNESARFADLLQQEARRPMQKGVLNSAEPESAERLKQLLGTLMNGDRGQRVYYTVPAAPLGAEETLTYHDVTIRQMLTDMGHKPRSLNEGLAVIYGECESTNYTGIGISLGGGLINVCLAYLSVPVFSYSIAKAGDFVDASAASVTGDMATRVRLEKEESFHFNGHFENKLHQVLAVYYDDMIQALVDSLAEAFAKSRNVPRLSRAVPLVLSGGSAMPQGFRDRFARFVGEAKLPFAVSEIRLAETPLYSTARGALVAALADGDDAGRAAGVAR